MYFIGSDSNGNDTIAKITREAYITDNFAAKLLISTNILAPEAINLITLKKIAHISSCDVTIPIEVLR